VGDVMLELVAELLQGRVHGSAGRVPQGAEGPQADARGEAGDEVQVLHAALARSEEHTSELQSLS
jgi:hypothetical protein